MEGYEIGVISPLTSAVEKSQQDESPILTGGLGLNFGVSKYSGCQLTGRERAAGKFCHCVVERTCSTAGLVRNEVETAVVVFLLPSLRGLLFRLFGLITLLGRTK